ncbi:HD domain-containing protein [bacterium]|nr:HD domain-containing protein [bacterium]
MGINFNPWRLLTGSVPQIQLNNRYSVPFGNNIGQDSFQNNSVERFFDEKYIMAMIKQNSELKNILSKNKIPVRLNMNELMELKHGHCKDSAEICAKIYKVLPQSLKSQVNIKDLKDGAMLHDFGKVLIPPEILNKHGKLTEEELKIMKLHSELGYQLLKNTGINNEVLSLVRNHHDNVNNKNFVPDINLQVLNLADRYSALTESRVYKRALTPQQALTIIHKDVEQGHVHPILYKALIEAVNNNPQNKMPLKSVSVSRV